MLRVGDQVVCEGPIDCMSDSISDGVPFNRVRVNLCEHGGSHLGFPELLVLVWGDKAQGPVLVRRQRDELGSALCDLLLELYDGPPLCIRGVRDVWLSWP